MQDQNLANEISQAGDRSLAQGGAGGGFLGSGIGGGALGGLLGGLGGIIGSFGQPAGLSELEQGIGQAEGTLQGYAGMGVPAWQKYGQETGRMLDPGQFESQLMQGFQGSPGLQFAEGQATGGLNRRLAALGLTGGGATANALQTQRQNIALQDYNNELMRRLGIFQGGTGGLQQIGTMGAQAAGNIANLQAQQAAAEAQAKQSQQSGLMGGLGSLAGTALSFL